MADTTCEVITPEFRRRFDSGPGAEGPVFTKEGRFYMVATRVKVEGRDAGQILTATLDTAEEKVSGHGLHMGPVLVSTDDSEWFRLLLFKAIAIISDIPKTMLTIGMMYSHAQGSSSIQHTGGTLYDIIAASIIVGFETTTNKIMFRPRSWHHSGVRTNCYEPRLSIDFMMTSSYGNIFRVTGHLCGEFTGPR